MSFDEIFDLTAGVYFFFYNMLCVGDSPWNYSEAIRVNKVMLVSLCAKTIKSVFEGDKISLLLWKEIHQFIIKKRILYL